MILKRLKENAEDYLEKEIKKVFITIPAYFNETQKEATKAASEAAGFEVLKIINEPIAAALAYGLKEKNDLLNLEENDYFFLVIKKMKKKIQKKKYFNFWFRWGNIRCYLLKIF